MSHPSRVRGLKPFFPIRQGKRQGVAPLAGAWIETPVQGMPVKKVFLSHPSRVRGLKHADKRALDVERASHPSRVRGLKQLQFKIGGKVCIVAPLAGAWIETGFQMKRLILQSVAPLAGAWIETQRRRPAES